MRKTGSWRKGARGAPECSTARSAECGDGNLAVLSSEEPASPGPENADASSGGSVRGRAHRRIGESLEKADGGDGGAAADVADVADAADVADGMDGVDGVDAEIREARAILAESQSLRNSIRGLLAERVTGDSCMHLVRGREAPQSAPRPCKENSAPANAAAESSPAAPGSGLDELLDRREARVTELREHMSHLQAATMTAGGEDEESLVLFPSDFTRLVDELFERHKRHETDVESCTSGTKPAWKAARAARNRRVKRHERHETGAERGTRGTKSAQNAARAVVLDFSM